jgi:hypothetical protein
MRGSAKRASSLKRAPSLFNSWAALPRPPFGGISRSKPFRAFSPQVAQEAASKEVPLAASRSRASTTINKACAKAQFAGNNEDMKFNLASSDDFGFFHGMHFPNALVTKRSATTASSSSPFS